MTLHVPETRVTRMMIGATELATMRARTHLIDTSRSSVADIDGAEYVEDEVFGLAMPTSVPGVPDEILNPPTPGPTRTPTTRRRGRSRGCW